MSKLITILLKGTTMLVFLSCFGNVFAQTQNIGEKKELQSPTPKVEENVQINAPKTQPSAEKFQLTTKEEPQGNSLEAQIARAEFYKAQYAHDPATQAKYQKSIDMLKVELLKANSNSKE
jgi:lipopolysaccharide export system protein LptA